jgi:hypothetical protein
MGKETRKLYILLVLFFWCLAASESVVSSVLAAEDGTFTGTWVADGSKEVLALGSEREAALFKFSGDVNLTNKDRQGKPLLVRVHRPCRLRNGQ